MPSRVFDNSLAGLVIKQMSRHAVARCLKPWQVPEHNYLIIKVPPLQNKTQGNLIKSFSFEKDAEGFFPTENFGDFSWEEGKNCFNDGCLKIGVGSSSEFKPVRFVSGAIPIVPGKKYMIKGLIKSEKNLESEERDGFLRIDFYSEDKLEKGERGIIAAVSARAWGNPEWQERWVEETAPEGAKFLRVSLQHESFKSGFYFDNIRVYETESSEEEKQIANKAEVSDNDAYPEAIF